MDAYLFVPGLWYDSAYVEGYWRPEYRSGWVWVGARYLADGTCIPSHWRPIQDVPTGFVWEAGFYDGERYVDGFWRPEGRAGFRWVSASMNAQGVWTTGYWVPVESRPNQVWIPGWFDGVRWVEGYWVEMEEYGAVESTWTPPAFTDGPPVVFDEPPLAVPVQ